MIQIECPDCGSFKELRKTCKRCTGAGFIEVEGKTEEVKTTSGDVVKSKKQVIPASSYIPDGLVRVDIWDKSLDK